MIPSRDQSPILVACAVKKSLIGHMKGPISIHVLPKYIVSGLHGELENGRSFLIAVLSDSVRQ